MARSGQPLSAPHSASVAAKDTNAQALKSRSTHAPFDIGENVLSMGRKVWDCTSMCQKRSGLPRSTVRTSPQTHTTGNAMR